MPEPSRLPTRRAALAWLGGVAGWRGAGAQALNRQRPITLVVPFGPGGIADLTARALAQSMGARLMQTIIVENRPSAGAIVGANRVAHAPPDGHTLLLLSNANALSVGLFRGLPFDLRRDFAPITLLGSFDLALLVNAASPWHDVGEWLAAARARPDKLSLATIAVGSTQQLGAELLKARAGIHVLGVPYKGTPELLTALRAGEVDAAFEILGPLLGQVRGGSLRALAVTSARRFPALPEVPTLAESGLPGFELASWNALAAPAGTPAPIVAALCAAARAALHDPALRARLEGLGVRPQPGTPAELQALLEREITRWGALVRAAGIVPQ